MNRIEVKKLSREELQGMGVFAWPVWEKETSKFPWSYSSKESCYILEGRVTVTPDGGEPVTFGAGDFVVFPEGMDCTWEIHEDVRKHYNFG
jgi:uncharacterized cupin superfamily protein